MRVSTRCSFVFRTYLRQATRGEGWNKFSKRDNCVVVQIVILAMVAAFLGLRLYSVLGRRAEHDEPPMNRPVHRPDAPAQRTAARPEELAAPRPGATTPGRAGFQGGAESGAETGVRAIVAADRRFEISTFLDGAKGAYGMVLEAYWRGDKVELGQLCDKDVFDGFVAAIDARTVAGETLDNRLIRIEEAVIEHAELDGTTARIRVRFNADVATVTRNAEGQVIAGSLDDAIESRDLWTFSRNLASREPDWLLDETDEG